MGEEVRAELPKMLPDRSGARPCPDAHSRERSPWEKVTFHIGSSASPESDFESRTKTMEERLQAWCVEPSARPGSAADDSALEAQDQQASRCSCAPPGFSRQPLLAAAEALWRCAVSGPRSWRMLRGCPAHLPVGAHLWVLPARGEEPGVRGEEHRGTCSRWGRQQSGQLQGGRRHPQKRKLGQRPRGQ